MRAQGAAAWGPGYSEVRSVHVHMCHLLRKIEDDRAEGRRLVALPGVGCRLQT